jgi:putative ABC transport system permease protein
MLKINLKFAFRNFRKYKVFSFINLTGLIIGITASLLISMYVVNELSFENIHKNRDRIYRVNSGFGKGASEMIMAGANTALAPDAVSNIPGIEKATRFLPVKNINVNYGEKHFKEPGFFYADTSFLKIFTFQIVKGNSINPLARPNSVVITESIVNKIFGSENPIGKTIHCGDNDLVVNAVAKDIPINTGVRWDYIAPFSLYEKLNPASTNWKSFGNCYTFLLMQKNVSDADLGKKLNELLVQNAGSVMSSFIKLYPQKLTEIYLHPKTIFEPGLTGNITYVYLFSIVAFLILIIACFNFMNLSVSRSIYRAKEVGVKKVLGANKFGIARQFISESFLLTVIAVLISAVLYEILYPMLSDFLGYKIAVQSIYNIYFYIILIAIVLITGFVSGIYPAFFLSKFQPVETLKGIANPGSAGAFTRKVFVVFQFTASIFLIIATLAIFKQLNFMRNADLGFDKSNLVLIDFPASSEGSPSKYKLLKSGLLETPNIKDVCGIYTLPGVNNKEMQSVKLNQGDNDNIVIRTIGVDYDFINTLGVHLISGRSFSEKFSTDNDKSVILNESAVKYLGLKNPVGTSLYIPDGKEGDKEVKIIGVIKDFNIASLKEEIDPYFLYINPERYFNVAVKLLPNQQSKTIAFIKGQWTKIFPDRKMDYSYMNQTYTQLYSSEERLAQLFTIFSLLAIFVACLGLFGLSVFTTEVRTKEIGVRKVLGATITGISLMLSKQFIRWVLIANLFAWPLAFFVVKKWLQNFAYRIELDWTTFVISSVNVLAVSSLAIIIQIVKAATANPVKTLRYE